IMEEYGIELSHTPTTEEFRSEMSKLAGSGLVPFCFPKWVDNFQYFYNSFGAWGGVYERDGQFIDGFQTEEMAAALAYIRQLYAEGILNQEFITTENSHMREMTYSAQAAGNIDYVTNYINYVQNTKNADKETDMHLIYKLVGPEGHGGSLNEAIQTAFVVSSRTKNPEAAVRVIEAIIGDSDLYQAFFGIGLEGHHYTLDEAGEITPTPKAANSGYKYTFNYLSDAVFRYDVRDLSYSMDEVLKAGIGEQGERIRQSIPHMGPNHNADVPVGISVAYDRVAPSIKSTRESIATKIVVGTVSVEEGMQEYANFWSSINGDKILEELNASN
ncbi:MAG: ABC transporter substrate-binding protein, partial [Spirochaetales bacterium]|nr:ABC transporter substrate-binding protein [Spirochaetales bacterium]